MHIHFPNRVAQNWREFFVHMGTITLGLLLALGLEHAGSALSRHQDLKRLQSDLGNENQRNLDRARQLVRIENSLVTQQEMAQNAAIRGATSHYQDLSTSDADAQEVANPVWRAAVTSTSVRMLSRDEIGIMGELDHLIHADDASAAQIPQFELLLQQPKSDTANQRLDFSAMSVDDRQQWARAVHADIINRQRHIANLQALIAALQATQSGANTLDKVVQAENSVM